MSAALMNNTPVAYVPHRPPAPPPDKNTFESSLQAHAALLCSSQLLRNIRSASTPPRLHVFGPTPVQSAECYMLINKASQPFFSFVRKHKQKKG